MVREKSAVIDTNTMQNCWTIKRHSITIYKDMTRAYKNQNIMNWFVITFCVLFWYY